MTTTLLTAGLACIIAAIVGGGLKAFGIEIPVLQSGRRQTILGGFGLVLVVAAAATHFPELSAPSVAKTPTVERSVPAPQSHRPTADRSVPTTQADRPSPSAVSAPRDENVTFTVMAKLLKDQESGAYAVHINGTKVGVLRITRQQPESSVKVTTIAKGVHEYSVQGSEEMYFYDAGGTRRDYAQLREISGQGNITVEKGKTFRINYSIRLGASQGPRWSLILSDTDLVRFSDE